jgi:hypothetical protein
MDTQPQMPRGRKDSMASQLPFAPLNDQDRFQKLSKRAHYTRLRPATRRRRVAIYGIA